MLYRQAFVWKTFCSWNIVLSSSSSLFSSYSSSFFFCFSFCFFIIFSHSSSFSWFRYRSLLWSQKYLKSIEPTGLIAYIADHLSVGPWNGTGKDILYINCISALFVDSFFIVSADYVKTAYPSQLKYTHCRRGIYLHISWGGPQGNSWFLRSYVRVVLTSLC